MGRYNSRQMMEPRTEKADEDAIQIKFWGARGSIPVPGPSTVKYGGNTPCVEVRFPDGNLVVLDAGTGLRELGNSLNYEKENLNLHLLITHYHWDHIQGLPLFKPAYHPNNVINIMGVEHPEMKIETIISAQMESIYFPVSLSYLRAKLEFNHILEGGFEAGDAIIRTIETDHTGNALSFKINYNHKSIVYMTDNELDRKQLRGKEGGIKRLDKVIGFIGGADMLIHDAQYLDSEYPSKLGWGHSTSEDAVWLAKEAGVKTLLLFHHDPDRVDNEIDLIVKNCRNELAMSGSKIDCYGASEEGTYSI